MRFVRKTFCIIATMFSMGSGNAAQWDYEDISLGAESFDLTGDERAKGITARANTILSLYDRSYAEDIVMVNSYDAGGYTTNINLYENSSINNVTVINSFIFLNDDSTASDIKGIGEVWASGNAVVRDIVFKREEGYEVDYLEGGLVLNDDAQAYNSQFILDDVGIVLDDNAYAENTECYCGQGYMIVDGHSVAINTLFTGAVEIELWVAGSMTTTTALGDTLVALKNNAQMNDSRFWGNTEMSLYDDSRATKTVFYGHGEMRLFNNARADDVLLNNDSEMHLFGLSTASQVTLNDDSLLTVQDSAVIHETQINGGQAVLYSGASATGNTMVAQNGVLVMENDTQASTVTLNGGTLAIMDLPVTSVSDVPATVTTLNSQDGTIAFLRDANDAGRWASLEIGTLTGTGRFLFNTDLGAPEGNFVTVQRGNGQFGVVVNDTGREITDSSATLNLVNDVQGDVAFNLQNNHGQAIHSVDAGVYMYSLYSGQNKDGMNGNVWYLGLYDGNTEDPDPDDPDTDGPNEPENPEPGEPGDSGNPKEPEIPGTDGNVNKVTTPSTDAILNMASAVTRVLNAELDGFRAWRGTLTPDHKHEGNVWGHYLGGQSRVNSSNGAGFRLQQNGLEMGADTATMSEHGSLIRGALMSFSDNRVKNNRGGRSTLDSYGLGMYATWLDNRGFYVDGVLKGNRLSNSLNARMTNGGQTRGNWHHYAASGVLEAGYRFALAGNWFIEPYLRTQAVQANAANVKLSNGVKANTGKPRSLTAETGGRVGGNLVLRNTHVAPYLRVGVAQELAKSNDVTINGIRFDNNVNGTSGNYGAGVSVALAANASLYGEINYRQGSHIEVPVQGSIGLKMSF